MGGIVNIRPWRPDPARNPFVHVAVDFIFMRLPILVAGFGVFETAEGLVPNR
jgi:hypothetical protein